MKQGGGRGITTVVAASALAALGLRLVGLRQSLYGDELYTYLSVVGHGLGHVISVVHRTEQTPPLFFVASWGAAKVGDPTVWIRVPSLIASTACVPLTYLIGRRTVGAVAGAAAAWLLAVAPFALFYGDEARAYSTVMFFVLAAGYCLIRSVQDHDAPWLIGFALLAICALYTHYIAIFPLGAQALWALVRFPEQRRRLLVSHGLAVAALVPWLVTGPSTDQHGFALLYPVTVSATAKNILHASFGLPFVNLSDLPGTFGWGLLALAGMAAGIGWLVTRNRAMSSRDAVDRDWLALLVLCAVAAPLGVVAYSVLRISIDAPRNMIVSLPAACLVAGAALGRLRQRSRVATGVVAAALLGALLISSVGSLTSAYRRPPWKQVAEVVNALAPRAAVVLQLQPFPVTDPWGRHPLQESLAVYLRRDLRAVEIPVGQSESLIRQSATAHPVFVVLGQITGLRQSPAPPSVPGVRLLEARSFQGFAPVALFRYGGSG